MDLDLDYIGGKHKEFESFTIGVLNATLLLVFEEFIFWYFCLDILGCVP